MALTSSCSALWTRADVLASPVLWGELHFSPSKAQALKGRALAAWLTRRAAALRRVCLNLSAVVGSKLTAVAVEDWLPPVLGSLAAAPLAELRLELPLGYRDAAAAAAATAAQVSTLTRLHLAGSCLQHVPPQLAALPGLADLSLSNASLGVGGGGAIAALSTLTALRQLDLGSNSLRRAPAELAALGNRLVDLDLGANYWPPGWVEAEAALAPVSALTGLTRLVLTGCPAKGACNPRSLARLPSLLTCFSGLAVLDLSDNYLFGERSDAAFQTLAHLTALSRLSLRRCGLRHLPSQLPLLRSTLAALDVGSNPLGGVTDRQPELGMLSPLTRLRELSLAHTMLRAVPPEVAALSALADLNLCGNHELGQGPAAFHPLPALTALTRLRLSPCSLHCLPPELATLTALVELYLSALGDGGHPTALSTCPAPGWEPLGALRSLTFLDLSWVWQDPFPVHPPRLPPQLARMPALTRLSLRGNGGLAVEGSSGEAWAVLAGCSSLTWLDLSMCELRGLPAVLSALTGLVELHASFNPNLAVAGEEDVLQLLRSLQQLAVLVLEACGGITYSRAPAWYGVGCGGW